jgi:hypothetical protein
MVGALFGEGFSCRLWTRDTDSLMEKSLLSWEKE